MKRTFKYTPLAGTNAAQPAIGTTLTAAVAPSPIPVTIAVADSSFFRGQDTAILDIQGANEERVLITAVPDGTHVTLSSIQFAHNNGVFLRLALLINNIYIQAKDGNAAALFIGNSPLSKNDGTLTMKKLVQVAAGTQPIDFLDTFTTGAGHNSFDSSEYWVVGTAADQYLVSLGIV